MFAFRCMKISVSTGIHYNIRKHSIYHRGIHFFLKKNLLLTNSLTSGLCMAIGDLVQQEFEYQSKFSHDRYDWMRIARMFIVGTVLGPLHHYYYIKLDQLLPKVNIKIVLFKILCDQAIASPLTLLGFYYLMGALERKSLESSTEEVKKKILLSYLGDCMYWPPIQFINFYYLPTHFRVVYINGATVIFNIFLSFMKHYDQY